MLYTQALFGNKFSLFQVQEDTVVFENYSNIVLKILLNLWFRKNWIVNKAYWYIVIIYSKLTFNIPKSILKKLNFKHERRYFIIM